MPNRRSVEGESRVEGSVLDELGLDRQAALELKTEGGVPSLAAVVGGGLGDYDGEEVTRRNRPSRARGQPRTAVPTWFRAPDSLGRPSQRETGPTC